MESELPETLFARNPESERVGIHLRATCPPAPRAGLGAWPARAWAGDALTHNHSSGPNLPECPASPSPLCRVIPTGRPHRPALPAGAARRGSTTGADGLELMAAAAATCAGPPHPPPARGYQGTAPVTRSWVR
eukprot:scaffold966_cov415-Prasinococcus_capsulatus_cf.AAC.8